MSFSARQRVFRAFVRARWLALRLRTRPALLAHQERQMGQWRQHVIESFPHHDPDTLRMNKANLMADFAAYNQERLSADDVRHGLETGYVHEDSACTLVFVWALDQGHLQAAQYARRLSLLPPV